MTNGKIFARVMTVAAMLAMAGCKIVSDPPKSMVVQDVEFLRGCWVEKWEPGGPAMGFLRLLADGPDYAGTLTRTVDGEMRTVAGLAFAQDGSRLTIALANGETMIFEARDPRLWPAEPNKAEFARYASSQIETVGIGGDEERLAIGFSDGLLGLVLFERDGCD